jgi:hypothetical protein
VELAATGAPTRCMTTAYAGCLRFYGFNIEVIAWFVQNKMLFGMAKP